MSTNQPARLDGLPSELLRKVVSFVIELIFETDSRRNILRAQEESLVSMSHVCRILRSICLPILWQDLTIDSISLLACIQHIFQPEFGRYVKTFTFEWELPDAVALAREMVGQASAEGPLQLAFVNRASRRKEIWNHRREIMEGGGLMKFLGGQDYLHDSPKFWSGPDGAGPVKGIESSQDVQNALQDILKHCSNVERLDWNSAMLPIPSSIGSQLSQLENLRSIRLRCEDMHCEDNFSEIHDCLKIVRRLSFTTDSDIDNLERAFEKAWVSQDASEPLGVRVRAATRSNKSPYVKFIYTSILAAAKYNLEEVEVDPEYIPILLTASLLPVFVGGMKVVMLSGNRYLQEGWSDILRRDDLERGSRCVEAVDVLRERLANCNNAKEIAKAAKDTYNNSNIKEIRGYAKLFIEDSSGLNDRVLKAREFLKNRK